MTATRLIDLIESPSSGFVFSKMTTAPWYTSGNALSLDIDYLYNNSGNKVPSSLVRHLAGDSTLSDQDITSLANIAWIKFGEKWTGLWTTYVRFAAKPYQHEITHGGTDTDTVTFGKNVDSTIGRTTAYNGKETNEVKYDSNNPRTTEKSVTGGWTDSDSTAITRTGKQTTTHKGDTLTSAFGFNSSSAVGVSKVGPDTQAGVTTELQFGTGGQDDPGVRDSSSGTVTRSYGVDNTPYVESVVESGSESREKTFTGRNDREDKSEHTVDSGTESTSHLHGHTVSDSKNAGELVSFQFEKLQKANLFDVIYADLDTVLTLRIWSYQ